MSLLFAQLTHATGLNDVCDALRNHSRWLGSLRGATAPPRNTLSHANKTRDSAMMEELFWVTLRHLEHSLPGGFGMRYKGVPRRFKATVSAIDSSTISLLANCMSWAKHRRRKAAAKLHLRLNLQTFLPSCAIIEEASHHDDTRVQRQLKIALATIRTDHRRQLKLPTDDNWKPGSSSAPPRSPGGREGGSPRRGFRGEETGSSCLSSAGFGAAAP